jgi:hypothetical protein
MYKGISQNYTQPAAARNMKPANHNIHSHLLTRLRPDEDPGKRARHVAAASHAVADPREKKTTIKFSTAAKNGKNSGFSSVYFR